MRSLRIIPALVVLLGLGMAAAAEAATYPPGFTERTVFSGLTNPSAIRFAADGRVFVAEKSGLVKVFDSLSDPQPDVFADLRTQVHNFWDRGLLGLALDPGFPEMPYVYVLYAHDAAIGGTAPRWGTPGATSDGCPTPPGATGDGCVVSGRLSRLTASGNAMVGSEQVLIEDWCQQYPSHSIGMVEFGDDGALYLTGGDGASFNFVDYGQDGSPVNPCGDPPGGVGALLTPPTAEGGALRSQDLRTTGDPTSLDGALLRVNPMTGAGLPDNPNAASLDANARRIVAYGLRNPFRFGVRPGTGEVWIGDVGWNTWEEIERLQTPTAAVRNFGWPCYEGSGRQSGYDSANLSICEDLYAAGPTAVQAPLYAWNHSAQVVPGETCPTGGSSAAGIAFAPASGSYPSEYGGALFFADYSRDCIWAMLPGSNGVPDPARIRTFAAGAANPVQLQIGPGGDLFYADFDGGTIRRVTFTPANQPPTAVATATPRSGDAPLTVNFDGAGSSDPDGDTLSYAWDLDADGQYDDSTSVAPTFTYTTQGVYMASLRVTDSRSASSSADRCGQHAAHRHDQRPGDRHHLEGRRRHHVCGRRHRRAGRRAPGIRAVLEPDPQSLPVQLPLSPAAVVRWRGRRLVHHPRSRVPLAPRAATHGDRLRRVDGHRVVAARPQDRRADAQLEPGWVQPGLQRDGCHRPVHQDRDPGIQELHLCPVPPDEGEEELGLQVMVRWRRAVSRRDRQRGHELHGDLQAALKQPRRSSGSTSRRNRCSSPSTGPRL